MAIAILSLLFIWHVSDKSTDTKAAIKGVQQGFMDSIKATERRLMDSQDEMKKMIEELKNIEK